MGAAAIVTMLLVVACGGNEGESVASTSPTPSEVPSPSESLAESPFPDGTYRSSPYSEKDIRAVVPDKFEEALLENELAGADSITWTYEMADGGFTLRYAVGGDTGIDTGEPGTYTATQDTITFVDGSGWRTTATWEVSGDQLRFELGKDVEQEFINDVPWKWYATYIMSEPFTKVA